MSFPPGWPIQSDWSQHLHDGLTDESFQRLSHFVESERSDKIVFPKAENVFRAFKLTSYAATRVVVLGQDPYHGPGQAHGLAFSVTGKVKAPPSLKNIFQELSSDLNLSPPANPKGDLSCWAKQGVLLLNTTLTVRQGAPGSHQKKGWENFTDKVIQSLNQHPKQLVFLLWGKPAARKKAMIDSRHTLLESPHPSPLSAYRGFFGSRPFSKTNAALAVQQLPLIQWQKVFETDLPYRPTELP